MALSDLPFADLILLPTDALLKGLPGHDRKLMPIPAECEQEIAQIREELGTSPYSTKGETFRFKHAGRNYRVARYHDIEIGQTLFLRRLPLEIPTISTLGINEAVLKWLLKPEQQKGLVIFCGAQASGKTTCAAAYIAARLNLYGGHAITFEIPVEMPLAGKHGDFGRCFQSELEREEQLAENIERSHRHGSPNIVYIGETRGKHAASEILRVALGSSDQLVVTTLHGLDISTGLERMVGWAKELDGEMAAQNLAHSLLAVIYLELKSEGDEKVLRVPQFLLVPFKGNLTKQGIRAQIRDGKFVGLQNDILEQAKMAMNRNLDDL